MFRTELKLQKLREKNKIRADIARNLFTSSQGVIARTLSLAPKSLDGQSPILWGDSPSGELKLKVAGYLERESKKSGVEWLPEEKDITPYHSGQIPDVSITDYFFRLFDYVSMREGTYITALILINRVRVDIPFDSFTAHRMLLGAMGVAMRMTSSDPHSHEELANVGGMGDEFGKKGKGYKELYQLEKELCEHPSIRQNSRLEFEEYPEILKLVLEPEIEYGTFYSTKIILSQYLFKSLCNIVSEYLPKPQIAEAPKAELQPYLNFCGFFPLDENKPQLLESKQKKRKLADDSNPRKPKKRKIAGKSTSSSKRSSKRKSESTNFSEPKRSRVGF